MEPFIGQLMLVAFEFAPRGWAFCNGQLMPIAQSTALFSLLGNTYGGDGITTFALPDLRGRAPLHHDRGADRTRFEMGKNVGTAEGVADATLLAAGPDAQPFLVMNWVIALTGVFPARN